MKGPVYKELRRLKRDGGDIYQKYADNHSITREEAQSFLWPFLYGAGLSKTKPIITEGEAIELLEEFNKLYSRSVRKLEMTTLEGINKDEIVYYKVGNRLIKVKGESNDR